MAANVSTKHEKQKHEEDTLNQVLMDPGLAPLLKLPRSESWIRSNPGQYVCDTFFLSCSERLRRVKFVALCRISVSQPVALLFSVEEKHPPLSASPNLKSHKKITRIHNN